MTWIPSIELIEIIYEQQLGMKVRYSNKQYLESALDLVKWGFPFKDSEMSIWEKAAILMRNIVQFHVFVDGCKRMGIHVAYVFLRKNGWLMELNDPEEMFRFPMSVAAGTLTLKEITEWFQTHSKKIV